MCGKDTIKIERKECPFSLYHPITGMKCLFFGKHFSCFVFLLPFCGILVCLAIHRTFLHLSLYVYLEINFECIFDAFFFNEGIVWYHPTHTHILQRSKQEFLTVEVGRLGRSIDRSIDRTENVAFSLYRSPPLNISHEDTRFNLNFAFLSTQFS